MGLMKYYDPVSKKRVPVKSGSIVNENGTNEATPDEIKSLKDVKIHVGKTQPVDTAFWLDTTP